MSNPLPDPSIAHKKTILTISGPHKDFKRGDGIDRQKFIINFTDGYTAEYCPPISDVNNNPKNGQEITFKVLHRGRYGDELELVAASSLIKDEAGSPVIISMSHHPAAIALNAAVRLAELGKSDTPVLPSDVMANADQYYDWLLRKASSN